MNIQHSLAGKRQQRLYVRYRQIRVFRQQRQINYTICAPICASVVTASHFHHMEQTRSLFTPHPLLPHGNTCYYSRIILNSFPLLLFSELFRHNYLRPNSDVDMLTFYLQLLYKVLETWPTSVYNAKAILCAVEVLTLQVYPTILCMTC